MSDKNSPWGSGGGSNGGSGGGKGPKGPKGPWGSGGGQRPPNRGPKRPQQTADLDNVIKGFKDKFGGKGPVKRGGGGPNRFSIPTIVIGVGLFMLLASSVYKIDQNEEGVILRFGKYSRTTEPGLQFKLPSPIETVKKVDVESERTINIPADRGENLMLTGDENIARIAYAVIWRVNNSADYVFNLQDVPGAVSDVAESAMREVVGKTELEPLITDQRDLVAANVQSLMQEMLDEYKAGVVVSQVELKESQEPRSVEAAFLEVVAAKQEAEQSILRAREKENALLPAAEAQADRLIQEARGYKDAVIAESKGDADRFRAIYQEYKLAPRVTRQRMYLETMESVYENADKMVLDNGAGSGVVPYLSLDELKRQSRAGGQ